MTDQPDNPRPYIVVGVGPGLGAALVSRFAQGGHPVAAVARSKDKLRSLVGDIQTNSEDAAMEPFACDATDPQDVERCIRAVRDWKGHIGGLIYNASASNWRGLLDTDPEAFEMSWRATTWGAYLFAKTCAPDMIEQGAGAMLFTGATSSLRGRANALAFSSAKFGLRGLAQALAADLWPKGIHVAHFIIDGVIDTEHEVPEGEEGDKDDPRLRPDDIAQSYWTTSRQPPSAWSLEMDLRPRSEAFFE